MENKTISLLKSIIKGSGSPWVSGEILKANGNKLKLDLSDLHDLVEKRQMFFYNGYFTIPQIAIAENIIANNCTRVLSNRPMYVSESVIQKHISNYEKKEKIHLDQTQKAAIVVSCKNNLTIITGGPGTGKTTVLKAIAYVLHQIETGKTIGFAAPTGKAAKRITEATGEEAVTFNSMLCIGVDEYSPTSVAYQTLIGDEFSMSDLYLSAALMASIQDGHRLIISGDVDQLPSVGPGCVLRDMIASGIIPTIMLTKTFRQDNSTVLFGNIQKIREGKKDLVEGPDFQMIRVDNNQQRQIGQLLTSYVGAAKEAGIYNTGCLLPFRKAGTLCTERFNAIIQNKCNHFEEQIVGGRPFKKNSPVIQLFNRNEVANGEIGKITAITKNSVTVLYGSEEITYQEDELFQISLAYSISIHKSQGSEYPTALVVATNEHQRMMSRNILYTGITRAKKKAILIYQDNALQSALSTDGNAARTSMLSEKIKYAWNKYQLIRKSAG